MDLSVVIPVYNGERYVRSCVESVVRHVPTGFEVEVLCVDDGSTDDSGKILDALAEKDPRVIVFHEKHRGVSAARNAGLAQATGTWVMFVDGDDLLPVHALSVLAATLDGRADISYYGFARFNDGTRPPCADGWTAAGELPSRVDLTERKDEVLADFLDRFRDHAPLVPEVTTVCSNIYRADMLRANSIRFTESLHHGEDTLFGMQATASATTLAYFDCVLYLYRQYGSSSSAQYEPKMLSQSTELLHTLSTLIETFPRVARHDSVNWPELYDYRVLWELLYCIVSGPFHPANPASYRDRKRQATRVTREPIFVGIFQRCRVNRYALKYNLCAFFTKHRIWCGLELYRIMVRRKR